MSANLEDIILTSKESVNIKMAKVLQNITIKQKRIKYLKINKGNVIFVIIKGEKYVYEYKVEKFQVLQKC